MKKAFIYTDDYLDYDYGPTHPLKIVRLQLAYELIRGYGLLDLPSVQLITTRKAEEEDLALFHSNDYLNILREGRVFKGERVPFRAGTRGQSHHSFMHSGPMSWSLN